MWAIILGETRKAKLTHLRRWSALGQARVEPRIRDIYILASSSEFIISRCAPLGLSEY
jgi:hypothetical protein